MKALIDTNVLIDYIAEREPYFQDAREILLACSNNKIDGCIAAHSISNIFYILRKNMSEEDRRIILKKLCIITSIIGIDKQKLINALDNASFSDMEDCLQAECAKDFKADYIITRNIKDFDKSSVMPILPADFVKKL
jgi:toxin-antitoxin system, toxin component, PIN family